MLTGFEPVVAERLTQLPPELRWTGEPTRWVRITRPGMRLHSFLEGLSVEADGTLWLVDVPHGRLFRVTPDGRWEVALAYAGEPHAARRRPDGSFVIVDYGRGLLGWREGDREPETIVAHLNTEPFRGLSDLAVAPNGDVWVTDSGRSSLSDPTGRLYRLGGDGRLDLVLANIPYPNGVALTPDGRFVLLAATRANAVWRLLADSPDPVWPMVGVHIQLSGGLGPDGLAVDPATGRLAVAQAQAGRAYVFDTLGDPLFVVRTAGLWTTSVAFAGDGALHVVDAQDGAIWRARLPEP